MSTPPSVHILPRESRILRSVELCPKCGEKKNRRTGLRGFGVDYVCLNVRCAGYWTR